MKSATQTLYALKEKAKAKLQDAQDKKDCATEIAESNLGYELTRAIAGLKANEEHLKIAKELLAQCVKDEESLLDLADETDATLEQQKATLKTTFDANISKLTASYNKALLELDAKYSGKFKKTVKKTTEKMLLLQQRVARYEGAVSVSNENVERLQNNKPKAVIRAVFASKKPERDLEYVRKVEEMNKFQASTRDTLSSVAVEQYHDTYVPPVEPTPVTSPKFVSRPLPPETLEEQAYWGRLTGIDLAELEAERESAREKANITNPAIPRINTTIYGPVSKLEKRPVKSVKKV